MDDSMDTERVPDASKRAAKEDSSPREKKRHRASWEEFTTVTPYEPKGVFNNTTRSLKKTVTPDIEGVATSSDDDFPIPPPPSSHITRESSQCESSIANKDHLTVTQPHLTVTQPIITHCSAEQPAIAPTNSQQQWPPTSDASTQQPRCPMNAPKSTKISNALGILLLFICFCAVAAFLPRTTSIRTFGHVIPPKHAIDAKGADLSVNLELFLTNVTLRDFLNDPKGFHLAMAPSFFGFFGYFGLLQAWDEGMANPDTNQSFLETNKIKSTAGASAGAMSAILLAMGVSPRKAAEFCGTIDLATFADPPGIGSFFKGDKFEQLMYDFMAEQVGRNHSMQMQDSKIPVAITGFDLQTLSTLVMTKGCVARSARASATFPFLFQPVHWFDADIKGRDYVLIDGGVLDGAGLVGISLMEPEDVNKRVVNIVVGNFGGIENGVPPGPSDMPPGLSTSEVLSISMRNLPGCGPWAMANGPRAVEASRKAMMASLDLPLYRGKELGHYELHIDARSFIE